MKKINIVSLFDGMACTRIAFSKMGFKDSQINYFASEVDKYSIKVAQSNYPEINQIGDVTKVKYKRKKLETEKGIFDVTSVDLVIGGSPCQGFSFSGKQLNFEDPRSKLFFEYVRIVKELKPKYFLLENVNMKQEFQDIISKELGVEPILINSKLITAQSRPRLYWTNIPDIKPPKDKNIYFQDIMEKKPVANNFYYSPAALSWLDRHGKAKNKKLKEMNTPKIKMQCLEASMHKKYSAQRFFQVTDINGPRYITPLECERCQTVPDNYSQVEGISNTQRYKMLGNGFTVDMITHILSGVFNKKSLRKDSSSKVI
jgi:DNA-cytosine methyltransferase